MDFEYRKRALAHLSDQLKEETFSHQLVQAYMKDTWFLKRNVVDREIKAPVALLAQTGIDTEYTAKYGIDPDNLRPIGKIAVLLPFNGINIMASKAIASSFYAGNKTIVKLPRKLKHAAPLYQQLISSCLPGVEFASDQQSSGDFLNNCISSPEIKAIVIYGDDKWIWSYKDAVHNARKKLIFEGPGKDPQIVMKDADLEKAVSDAVQCGLLNGGQSCSAMERFFVHESIVDEFVERLTARLLALRLGDHEDDGTDIGPIHSEIVLNRMAQQVEDARSRGAAILLGGKAVPVNGTRGIAFLPTIITGCTTDMKVIQEENFGPLFPIITFSSYRDLATKVDHTRYGLNASLYGTSTTAFLDYMENNHRNFYVNSTVTTAVNSASRILDGGFRNSGFIWEWKQGEFMQREGQRMLLKELSAEPGPAIIADGTALQNITLSTS